MANAAKHFLYSLLAVALTAVASYFLADDAITKFLNDAGVAAPLILVAVPAFHAAAVYIQNFVKSLDGAQ